MLFCIRFCVVLYWILCCSVLDSVLFCIGFCVVGGMDDLGSIGVVGGLGGGGGGGGGGKLVQSNLTHLGSVNSNSTCP